MLCSSVVVYAVDSVTLDSSGSSNNNNNKHTRTNTTMNLPPPSHGQLGDFSSSSPRPVQLMPQQPKVPQPPRQQQENPFFRPEAGEDLSVPPTAYNNGSNGNGQMLHRFRANKGMKCEVVIKNGFSTLYTTYLLVHKIKYGFFTYTIYISIYYSCIYVSIYLSIYIYIYIL